MCAPSFIYLRVVGKELLVTFVLAGSVVRRDETHADDCFGLTSQAIPLRWIAAAREIRDKHPQVKIIGLSDYA